MSDSPVWEKSKAMKKHIAKIRGCKLGCYTNNYITPIRTRGRRTITIEELRNGRPLVDDWGGRIFYSYHRHLPNKLGPTMN